MYSVLVWCPSPLPRAVSCCTFTVHCQGQLGVQSHSCLWPVQIIIGIHAMNPALHFSTIYSPPCFTLPLWPPGIQAAETQTLQQNVNPCSNDIVNPNECYSNWLMGNSRPALKGARSEQSHLPNGRRMFLARLWLLSIGASSYSVFSDHTLENPQKSLQLITLIMTSEVSCCLALYPGTMCQPHKIQWQP